MDEVFYHPLVQLVQYIRGNGHVYVAMWEPLPEWAPYPS